MTNTKDPHLEDSTSKDPQKHFIVLCTSGFENAPSARSALMFATLAAAANLKTILFCVQNAVDIMSSLLESDIDSEVAS